MDHRLPDCFNPRPPAESDAGDGKGGATTDVFQSAPPCGERLCCAGAAVTTSAVFQSAPPCGERRLGEGLSGSGQSTSFNPRPPAESDLPGRSSGQRRSDVRRQVSIRAPLRRATPRSACKSTVASTVFQSAPPCGERRSRICRADGPSTVFQSAPPCGERRCRRMAGRGSPGFNPRPPAESDLLRSLGQRLFQSAGRATQSKSHVSIRAPLRRATGRHYMSGCRIRCFNPRPPAESD